MRESKERIRVNELKFIDVNSLFESLHENKKEHFNFELPFCKISRSSIERFHSRGQQSCKYIGTKETFYIRKEFNSHRISFVHQHGRRFIVLVHQYGCRDVCVKTLYTYKRKPLKKVNHRVLPSITEYYRVLHVHCFPWYEIIIYMRLTLSKMLTAKIYHYFSRSVRK